MVIEMRKIEICGIEDEVAMQNDNNNYIDCTVIRYMLKYI